MIDLEILKAKGLTDDNLREWLAGNFLNYVKVRTGSDKDGKPTYQPGGYQMPPASGSESPEDCRHRLIQRIRSRIQEGMTRNFQDFRVYYALDVAWDTPFRQITPTILSTFLDSDPTSDEVHKAVAGWGLSHLITEDTDPKTGKKIKSLNIPTFFSVLVPLVRAYVTIRWAKIMNDRRQFPFYKFEPAKNTTELSLKCEALTDRVQVMSSQYGFYDVTKQAVLKMLHYGLCLMFPKECWHSEEQWKYAEARDVANNAKKENGDPASVGDLIKVVTREGLRHHLPHPSRVFRDLAHGPWTFNYDNGCEYGGYWRIARYREIEGNPSYWNRDKIGFGAVDYVSGNRLYFTSVYSACTLTIPTYPSEKTPEGPVMGAGLGLGAGDLDREKEIATLYYGTEHGDQGVLITEYFEKLIPKDNGLGDYDCPVWFRFVIASDSCTVIYAEPLPYCPIVYYGYDQDESRSKNASLSLETLPFQDQFSNLMTQILLTCKQNLANLTMLDEDQLPEGILKKVTNLGQTFYQRMNIFPYSSKKAARMQNKLADVAHVLNLPKGNVAELITVLRQVLDVLERVLVMSSQEVGQAASHELRAEEVRNIQASTSTRLVFTATPVDIAADCHKRQIYQGLMAYGDEHFACHIPSETTLRVEELVAMGFTFSDEYVKNGFPGIEKDRYVRAKISKHKLAVDLWEFATTKPDPDRSNDAQTAAAMSQIILNLMNNPITAQAIGPDQAIDLANHIWRLSGLPRDMKLRNMSGQGSGGGPQQQLQQICQQVMEALQPELHPLMDRVNENTDAIQLVAKALNLNVPDPRHDSGTPETPPGPGPAAPPGMAAPTGMPIAQAGAGGLGGAVGG